MLKISSQYCNERISSSEKCFITQCTFQELIQEKTEAKPPRPFVIALCHTSNGRLRRFDASALLTWFDQKERVNLEAIADGHDSPNTGPFGDFTSNVSFVKVDFLMTWHIKEEFQHIESAERTEAPRARQIVKASRGEKDHSVFIAIRNLVQQKLEDQKLLQAEKWLLLLAHDYPREPFVFEKLHFLIQSFRQRIKFGQQNRIKAQKLVKRLNALKRAALIESISTRVVPAMKVIIPVACGFFGSYLATKAMEASAIAMVRWINPKDFWSFSQIGLMAINSAVRSVPGIFSFHYVDREEPVIGGNKKIEQLFLGGWNAHMWSRAFLRFPIKDANAFEIFADLSNAVLSTGFQVASQLLRKRPKFS